MVGPKRIRNPGIAFENLPKIDVILISHSHYDHLDFATIKKIYDRDKPQIIVGLGVDKQIKRYGKKIIAHSLDWYESKKITDDVEIFFTPAHHWSNRSLFDRNKSLWGSFVIKTTSGNIYFAGDTAYNKGTHFKEICKRFGPCKLALLPIGAYEPYWFMKSAHMNPRDAVMAHIDLKSKQSIAMHFGTFKLTDEACDDPPKHLAIALKKFNIDSESFRVLDHGESFVVSSSKS